MRLIVLLDLHRTNDGEGFYALNSSMSDSTTWIYADVVCDLFHHGHVEFFRQARAFGDALVVGLVGDADAASYKPAPVLTFAERLAVVRACRYVDRVLEEPAPLHADAAFLDRIGARFCCHGDDMTSDALRFWYGDLVDSGRLKVVHYTAGISSRQIFERVAQRLRQRGLGARP
jgi:cytidyltransferase-like protein